MARGAGHKPLDYSRDTTNKLVERWFLNPRPNSRVLSVTVEQTHDERVSCIIYSLEHVARWCRFFNVSDDIYWDIAWMFLCDYAGIYGVNEVPEPRCIGGGDLKEIALIGITASV